MKSSSSKPGLCQEKILCEQGELGEFLYGFEFVLFVRTHENIGSFVFGKYDMQLLPVGNTAGCQF
jgi:hypothetical protein